MTYRLKQDARRKCPVIVNSETRQRMVLLFATPAQATKRLEILNGGPLRRTEGDRKSA